MGPRPLFHAKGLNFVSDADDRSVLLVNVYQKHRVKKDALVGRLIDTIGGVLGKLKDGGTMISCVTCSTDASSATKVLEDTLRKDTPDGADGLGITIKFTLAAEPRGDVDVDERQATDAVTRATSVNLLSSTSAAVGLLGSAVDTGTNVMAKVQTFETTWGVLLQRMELFNKIVDGIAQVFGAQCLDSFTD